MAKGRTTDFRGKIRRGGEKRFFEKIADRVRTKETWRFGNGRKTIRRHPGGGGGGGGLEVSSQVKRSIKPRILWGKSGQYRLGSGEFRRKRGETRWGQSSHALGVLLL